ncbi:uncharacterized protein LOC131162838 [Malania oleifera]|uniref:uncharacterized protein LOC131162838 n=1 Tax=Malania oleifera TaxID=397392 RepID=UPI0025AE1E25|nr:uncharacterized protein LOC131162838 [Malania oleifera]
MDKIARSSREQGGSSPVQVCTIEKFMKMNSPTFSGAIDPTVVENWVQEVERILIVIHCTNEQIVLYATSRLAGEAERWWVATREARVQEFLSLSQGSLTVQQYAERFIEFLGFFPYIVPDEVKKARMFKRNLRRDIYRQVTVLRIQDFA